MLNATCPGNVEVHADQGGPVFLNGKQASLKRFSDSYYEAKGAGITLTIMINPDGTPSLSYTGPQRANGVCSLVSASPSPAAAPAPAWPDTPANRQAAAACSQELARRVKVAPGSVEVTDVMSAEAGVGVTMKVPGVNTPWSCMYARGQVRGLTARE
jgi:hypothetical protein